MSRKVGRNDPCPCGSGSKHKHCCGEREETRKASWSVFGLAAVVLASVAGAAVLFFGIVSGDSGGRVWSAEHGHWHDASKNEPGPQPPGPAPPGKVWSSEHGHWHDATDTTTASAEPPGPAPPGKVWSSEHGHWHDAN